MRIFQFLIFLFIFPTLSQAEIVEQVFQKIEKEWQDLEVKIPLQIKPQVPVGGFGKLGFGLGYSYVVQPAYRENEHQRIDSYLLKMGVGLEKLVSLGLSAEAQVSFSRIYSNKKDALSALPQSPVAFPRLSKEALSQLKPGMAARFEISSDGTLGAAFSQVVSSGSVAGAGSVSAFVKKGKRFIIDVYRLDEQNVRLRLITTRNMGSFGFKAAATPLDATHFGFGFVESVLNDVLSCKAVSFSFEQSLTERRPVDTLMVDYTLDLTSSSGAMAYDLFFSSILQIKIGQQLSLVQDSQEFYLSVWEYAKIVDDIYQKQKMSQQPVVYRNFKGRTLTDFRTIKVGSDCFRLWGASDESYNATTSVRSFDANDIGQDFFYLGTQNVSEVGLLFNFLKEEKSLGVNTLFSAQREDEQNPLSLQPIELSDLVLVRTLKDKKMFDHELRSYVLDLNYQYPQFFADLDFKQYGDDTKDLFYSKIEFIFHPESLHYLKAQNLDLAKLKKRLTSYILGYVQRANSKMLSTSPGPSASTPSPIDRFMRDIQSIARRLEVILSSKSTLAESVESFSSLRKNPLFMDIGAGFMMSLMSPEVLQNGWVEANISIGAKDSPVIEKSVSASGSTPLYKNLEFILSTINDRSFDLRLQK